jgi:hypothetical protein
MDPNEPILPNALPTEQRAEEEIRTLLLHLLRLVAAEIAEFLHRQSVPGTPRECGSGGAGRKSGQ